jgi:hypothetical protein
MVRPAGLSRTAPATVAMGWSQSGSFPSNFTTRWDAAYASFPPQNEIVQFGGDPEQIGDPWWNDTWVYASGAWARGPAAPAGLTPRGGAAFAYDPAIGQLVLFGGAGQAWPPFDETWLFDGAGWTKGPDAPTELRGRLGAGMVYDPDIGAMVMVGGSGEAAFKDTWLFDGSEWTAGPAAPQGFAARDFFAISYDPIIHRVVVAGGDGGTDVWFFDGSAWTKGPALPSDVGPRERVRMDFDPQLEGDVLFGGIGPGSASPQMWMLRDGGWSRIMPESDSSPWPAARLDGAVCWNGAENALILFGGTGATKGSTGNIDTWRFVDAPPVASSLSLSPVNPRATQTVRASPGSVSGGYGSLSYEYVWFINGQQVPGATGSRLTLSAQAGDQVQAEVRLTDAQGLSGSWVRSAVATVS